MVLLSHSLSSKAGLESYIIWHPLASFYDFNLELFKKMLPVDLKDNSKWLSGEDFVTASAGLSVV